MIIYINIEKKTAWINNWGVNIAVPIDKLDLICETTPNRYYNGFKQTAIIDCALGKIETSNFEFIDYELQSS